MISRYTLPEMEELWSSRHKYERWLKVEILACEAWAKLGKIPESAVRAIKQNARVDEARIAEIEQETRHDVIAFVQAVSETVGDEGKHIHYGLTSTDVVDTALASLLVEAADLIIDGLELLYDDLTRLAQKHRDTLMIGRTHGVHAEPTTLGMKFALYREEIGRNLNRMKRAQEAIAVGKISGAVGNYANIPPFVEEYVCRALNLKPSPISTQVLQRDRHAEFLSTLAIIAGTLDKLAVEIRSLQRTEIRELEEPFYGGQRGSSAMPHKRNPILCERISGLARIVRGNALAAFEDIPLWHERDISHSSAERVILPDSTTITHFMLYEMHRIISGLRVFPENMRRNMEMTNGLVFSQRVLLLLVDKGFSRTEAYKIVQRAAMKCYEAEVSLRDSLLSEEELRGKVSVAEIDSCFSYDYYLKPIAEIFRRLGLGGTDDAQEG